MIPEVFLRHSWKYSKGGAISGAEPRSFERGFVAHILWIGPDSLMVEVPELGLSDGIHAGRNSPTLPHQTSNTPHNGSLVCICIDLRFRERGTASTNMKQKLVCVGACYLDTILE